MIWTMILEWIEFIRQPSSKIARKMGYVYSTIALQRRHQRQKRHWKSHLDHCHAFWKTIVTEHKPKVLVVLGSGPVLETPIAWLYDQVDEIHLVDIVHPARIVRKWGPDKKVVLDEMDLTGLTEAVLDKKTLPSPGDFHPPKNIFPNADLVVSANLLSQLSLEPMWYLGKKFGLKEDSPQADALIQKLSSDHVAYLKSFNCPSYVFTDVERTYISPKGEVLEKHPSRIHSLADLGELKSTWPWELCPLGEVSKLYSITMTVNAYRVR